MAYVLRIRLSNNANCGMNVKPSTVHLYLLRGDVQVRCAKPRLENDKKQVLSFKPIRIYEDTILKILNIFCSC